MIEYYGTSRQNLHLKKAENYARKLEPINEYENLIAKENLYTLLQTLSKWNFFLGNDIVAEKSLIEMCELDPLDSRAFSEYGLYLYKKKRFVKAEQYFSKAIELGPPSIGMNLYFLIKTKEALGVSKFDLISLLLQVIEIDPCTISPWIDIIEFYIEQGEKELCRNFVCKMFNNPQLKDQLNEQEVEKYSSFFN